MMNKLTQFLVGVPVVSLSLVNLNLAAIATTIANPNLSSPQPLIAQRVNCSVVNIRTGQLALRFSPNGRSRAGLNNGNTVALLRNGTAPWSYVRVLQGSSRAVNGLEGWVNSNYLSCGDRAQAPEVSCRVVGIRTGQLALRLSPNGQSRAGLNNGNIVALLRNGTAPWSYVRVLEGSTRAVNGLEGWVNSSYLACND